MTKRVEYIQSEAYNLGYEDGHKDAIEKACKWLIEHAEIEIHNTDMRTTHIGYNMNFIEDFRKAMEGIV